MIAKLHVLNNWYKLLQSVYRHTILLRRTATTISELSKASFRISALQCLFLTMTSSILKNYNQCYLCSGEVASCNGPTSPTTTGSTTAGIKRVTQRSPTAFTPSEHYSPSSSESNGNSHCSTSRVRPETLLKDRESFTFPRSAKANFVYTPESEENELSCLVKTKKTMSDESSKTVSFKTPVFHSNSLDKVC